MQSVESDVKYIFGPAGTGQPSVTYPVSFFSQLVLRRAQCCQMAQILSNQKNSSQRVCYLCEKLSNKTMPAFLSNHFFA
jgi:hypothetical protein